jgi:uncharacterized membrane protein YozB (DUF420 family)
MHSHEKVAGFLPWRGTLMIDVIVVAMVLVLIALAWSLYSVKYLKRYQRHKAIQITLSAALLVLLALFEIDLRYLDDWRAHADGSPFFDAATGSGLAVYSLWVHLVFATSTLGLWLLIIVRAVTQFPNPPGPNRHSPYHSRWGLIAAVDMVLTAVSGWVFYLLAFVA